MTRTRLLVGLVGAATALSAGALAWACTAVPLGRPIVSAATGAPVTSGPAGTVLTVSGTGFAHDLGPVKVHWNGQSGPVLATATPVAQTADDPVRELQAGWTYFSTSLTVPANAAPGLYTIVLEGPDRSEGVNNYGTIQFKQLQGGFEVTAPVTTAPVASTPVASTPVTSQASANPGTSATPASSPSAQPNSVVAASPSDVGAPAPTAQPVAVAADAATTDAGALGPAGQPSIRSAQSDLWSGFAPSQQAANHRGLDAKATDRSSPAMALGFGLVSVGMVILAMAGAVTIFARRRVAVRAGVGR